jgi:hypothetical protein
LNPSQDECHHGHNSAGSGVDLPNNNSLGGSACVWHWVAGACSGKVCRGCGPCALLWWGGATSWPPLPTQHHSVNGSLEVKCGQERATAMCPSPQTATARAAYIFRAGVADRRKVSHIPQQAQGETTANVDCMHWRKSTDVVLYADRLRLADSPMLKCWSATHLHSPARLIRYNIQLRYSCIHHG